jgi:hypothetical protein
MAKVIITKETRTRLLSAASSGEAIASLDFMLTRGDRDFQAELVRVAKQAKNELFLQSLDRFLAQQNKEYTKQFGSNPDVKASLKLSPKYNPTGMGFQEFLETKGLYYYPQQFVRFVSGGAFESNRRRH